MERQPLNLNMTIPHPAFNQVPMTAPIDPSLKLAIHVPDIEPDRQP
jgi:hypothetical protein